MDRESVTERREEISPQDEQQSYGRIFSDARKVKSASKESDLTESIS
jgi:hypothetical protein